MSGSPEEFWTVELPMGYAKNQEQEHLYINPSLEEQQQFDQWHTLHPVFYNSESENLHSSLPQPPMSSFTMPNNHGILTHHFPEGVARGVSGSGGGGGGGGDRSGGLERESSANALQFQEGSSSTAEIVGKYVCDFPSCELQLSDRTFSRKSDFRRHIDKHTRPYRCPHDGCQTRPGFGWMGGLNRHLEEVHNLLKTQHRCRYTNCRRHILGFSRLTNLRSHMRKVHNCDGSSATGGNFTGCEDESGSAVDSGDENQWEREKVKEGERERERVKERERERMLREVEEAERDVVVKDGELLEAVRRKADALERLERLRLELGTLDAGGSQGSSPVVGSFHTS